ncbi:MAG: ATP-grasp domain-containing protein [Opitutales bacterium]
MKKQVFIIGLDEENKARLERLPQAAECDFKAALTYEEIRSGESYPVGDLLRLATERMAACDRVDAVASFYDFPGTVLVPVLAERFGLPGPSLESVLKCENKYWSRLEQQKAIPDNIPLFRVFDPNDEQAYEKIDLLPPFWIKPIKSFRSYLAYQINGAGQFHDVMPYCREKGPEITGPFIELMQAHGMPPEISEMNETFIAESSISGFQCTLEGYSYQGRVAVYGIVDSIREPDSSSFSRYEYPTCLPLEIQHRLIDTARLAVQQIGYDHGPFNVEFFYEQSGDQIWLLEINPRISESHAELFEKVNGISHQAVMLDLALGRKPAPLEFRGDFNVAAKFMLRAFERGTVTGIPDAEALRKLEELQPGTRVKPLIEPGQELEDLERQDMYSFEIANLFIGGRDRHELLEKHHEALKLARFEIGKEPTNIDVRVRPSGVERH